MKKLVKLLSLLLALCLVLCACGGATSGRDFDDDDDDKDEGSKKDTSTVQTTAAPPAAEELLEGEWTAFIDCAPFFNLAMESSMGAELASYFDFSGLGFEMTLTFDGVDGYAMAVDQDSLKVFADDVLDVMVSGLRSYLELSLASVLGSQSLDDYLAANGMTFDQLLSTAGLDAESLAQQMLSAFEDVDKEGTYAVEDGKLKLDSDLHAYALDGNTLTIQVPDGNTNEMVAMLFPMELEKTN